MATRWRQPAEWSPHRACWLAWPSHPQEWPGELEGARRGVAAMAAALAPGEPVQMLVLPGESEQSARRALDGVEVQWHHIPFGDIWLRDTGPVFLTDAAASDRLAAAAFRWTGWAGKYLFDHDDQVASRIARAAGAELLDHALAAEGGALEVDGDGAVLSTRQCLLHPGRNPGWSASDVEQAIRSALGADLVLWLDRGLANDHTDGHVDTLARFVAPGRVVCMEPAGRGDPNREVLAEIARDLAAMRDARGRALEVVRLPSPGRVESRTGDLLAASYVNFYIGNRAVVVPTYGVPADREMLSILAELLPTREVIGVDARAISTGGGGLHCISQQQPEAGA